MKTYFQLIAEAKATKAQVLEAERLRKEAIKAYKEALKKPNLATHTIQNLKRRLATLTTTDYTNTGYSSSNLKVILLNLKNADKDIKRELELNALHQKWDREEKKILANPYTICDLFSNPSPKKFIDLIKGEIPDADAKWITELEKIKDVFEEWFDSIGGRKMKMTNRFAEMVACKNRAPWAAWSGKAYRGVGRSPSVVSKYDFTGEVKKIDGSVWLVAKGSYKSRYGAQSWSDEWRTAQDFAVDNTNRVGYPIAVVFEVNLKRSDTLLSPDVVKQVSGYGISEREVIRVGNAPIPVTIYVSATTIEEAISRKLEKSDGLGNKARKNVYDRAVALFGVKCADAFAKTKEFKDLVKDFA